MDRRRANQRVASTPRNQSEGAPPPPPPLVEGVGVVTVVGKVGVGRGAGRAGVGKVVVGTVGRGRTVVVGTAVSASVVTAPFGSIWRMQALPVSAT